MVQVAAASAKSHSPLVFGASYSKKSISSTIYVVDVQCACLCI